MSEGIADFRLAIADLAFGLRPLCYTLVRSSCFLADPRPKPQVQRPIGNWQSENRQ
jgi:hypothetical protein